MWSQRPSVPPLTSLVCTRVPVLILQTTERPTCAQSPRERPEPGWEGQTKKTGEGRTALSGDAEAGDERGGPRLERLDILFP